MRALAGLLAALVTASGPAEALSCLRPDPLMLYRQARDSSDVYRMVAGRLEPVGPVALPQPASRPGDERPARTPARLVGRQLGPDGFAYPHDAPVTLELTCLSAWCAAPPETGTELLVIARITGGDPVVALGPCPSNALPVTEAALAAIAACHAGGPCGD